MPGVEHDIRAPITLLPTERAAETGVHVLPDGLLLRCEVCEDSASALVHLPSIGPRRFVPAASSSTHIIAQARTTPFASHCRLFMDTANPRRLTVPPPQNFIPPTVPPRARLEGGVA